MRYEYPPMELGEVLSGKDADGNLINEDRLGQVFEFPAQRLTGGPRAAKGRTTGKAIRAVLLRNTSGIALTAKRVGTLAYATAGEAGIETVDGYCDLTAERRCVIIDSFLTSTVADDDIFWGILNGRCTVTTTLAAGELSNIAAGAPLLAATAVTSQAVTAGRVQNVTLPGQTGDTATFQAAINLIGFALSARTTGETGSDLLIDACLRY
jgi:hypothetical protein